MNDLTVRDYSPTDLRDLDERFMYERFKDRSVSDALAMLLENPDAHVDDLGYMGLKAFDYYLPAFFEFLRSEPPADALQVAKYLVRKRHAGFGEDKDYFAQTKRLVESIESLLPSDANLAISDAREERAYRDIRDYYRRNSG